MDFTELTFFDYIIMTIILFTTVSSFLKGFILSLLSFITIVGTAIVAPYLAPQLEPYIKSDYSYIISMLTVYIVIFICMFIISKFISKQAKKLSLEGLDRSLGFTFGMIKGIFYSCIIFMIIMFIHEEIFAKTYKQTEKEKQTTFKKKGPDWLKDAQIYGLLQIGSRVIIDTIPDSASSDVSNKFGGLKDNALKMLTSKTQPNAEEAIKSIDVEVIRKQLHHLTDEQNISEIKNK
jgi:membrane protein required for colicin V production